MGTRTITLELPEALVERLEETGFLNNSARIEQMLTAELIAWQEEQHIKQEIEKYVALRQQQHPDLPEHNLRQLAVLDWIKANPDKESDEWWQEFEQFLRENRFRIRERDLGLDDD